VLALGIGTSIQILVQAIALAVGVGLYSVDWSSVRRRLRRRRNGEAIVA